MPYSEKPTSRSLAKVGARLGKSTALMERWSTAHNWQERCREYDNELQGEELEARKVAVRAMQQEHIDLADKLTQKAREALENVDTSTMKPWDILHFLKLALELERRARFELLAESELRAKSNPDSVSYSPMIKLIESLEQARAERQEKAEDAVPNTLIVNFTDFDKDQMTTEEQEQYNAIRDSVNRRVTGAG
jgi:hypothetical protein